jgi:hypothetical protein
MSEEKEFNLLVKTDKEIKFRSKDYNFYFKFGIPVEDVRLYHGEYMD